MSVVQLKFKRQQLVEKKEAMVTTMTHLDNSPAASDLSDYPATVMKIIAFAGWLGESRLCFG
jgi:hypothetical protein